jgi:diadenosine tetraphosphate (Ap4A) HIT family hydrolase
MRRVLLVTGRIGRMVASVDERIDCFSCSRSADVALPVRECVVRTDRWRVAHAFDSALPGWLVVVPTRHVTAFAELTDQESAELGVLVGRLSRALETVTGCLKTYVVLFAEAEGFSHLHVHVVPRGADLPDDRKGPRVFGYLGAAETDRVPAAEMDRIAEAVAAFLPGLTT